MAAGSKGSPNEVLCKNSKALKLLKKGLVRSPVFLSHWLTMSCFVNLIDDAQERDDKYDQYMLGPSKAIVFTFICINIHYKHKNSE